MALLAAGSVLVAGSGASDQTMAATKTLKIRVERSFYWDKQPRQVGEVLEVPAIFGLEMLQYRKASAVAETAEPEEPAKKRGTRKPDNVG